jgi:hypothetical protein
MIDGENIDIGWVGRMAVDALQPYVDEVLDCIQAATGIRIIFVSDQTNIDDFVCREHLPELARRLGVTVRPSDLLYEIAIRLRDK